MTEAKTVNKTIDGEAITITEGELCYTGVMNGNKYALGIVKAGESGYYPYRDSPAFDTIDDAEKCAMNMNDKMGISNTKAYHMQGRSFRTQGHYFD